MLRHIAFVLKWYDAKSGKWMAWHPWSLHVWAPLMPIWAPLIHRINADYMKNIIYHLHTLLNSTCICVYLFRMMPVLIYFTISDLTLCTITKRERQNRPIKGYVSCSEKRRWCSWFSKVMGSTQLFLKKLALISPFTVPASGIVWPI